MIVDYHIHTPYCGHAQGKIVDYIEAALSAGLDEIAFTDHLGRYYLSPSQRKRHYDWGMDMRALRKYFSELDGLREVYEGRISVRIGLEIDFIEGAEDLLAPALNAFPFDFLLGSLHCLPRFGWRHLADTSHTNPDQVYEEYFLAAKALVASGQFHSLAHLDFLWRYVKWPRPKKTDVFGLIEETVDTVAQAGMAMEINANAYLWSQLYQVRGGDPFEVMLDEIRRHNAPVTLGSDAHAPQHVGKSFPNLIALLQQKGITTVARYNKGNRTLAPLH